MLYNSSAKYVRLCSTVLLCVCVFFSFEGPYSMYIIEKLEGPFLYMFYIDYISIIYSFLCVLSMYDSLFSDFLW